LGEVGCAFPLGGCVAFERAGGYIGGMTDELVLLAHDGPISTLTVNRPDALNSLSADVLRSLAAAIATLSARKQTRCVIVTGAGDKAFVAGADIAAMSAMSAREGAAFARLGQSVFAALEALPMPVMAAVNGFALGGGCEIALACDFIYASEHAKFGQPEVKLGVIPGFGGTQRLARRIGLGMARELIYTGRMIGPEEALRIGLVNLVVPRRELIERALQTARAIAGLVPREGVSPSAVSAAKRVLNVGADVDLAAAIELEADAFGACFDHEDQKEGMRAFLGKREPKFQDR
jgi:enoyl-CoA hydratase